MYGKYWYHNRHPISRFGENDYEISRAYCIVASVHDWNVILYMRRLLYTHGITLYSLIQVHVEVTIRNIMDWGYISLQGPMILLWNLDRVKCGIKFIFLGGWEQLGACIQLTDQLKQKNMVVLNFTLYETESKQLHACCCISDMFYSC